MQMVDLCKGYWNPQIKNWGIFFEIISFESNKNAAIAIFLKKRRKGYSASEILRISFYIQKSIKHIYKDLKIAW